MLTFIQAIARDEGFDVPGTRPYRNNNPGDIEYGRFARAHGSAGPEILPDGTQGRFATFPTPEIGWAALKALLQSTGYLGLTVAEALNRWAPPSENQTNSYIANVVRWTDLTPETKLTAENVG